ncbi:hypothetical protein NUM3379_34670 [Kineococcus sp. NUM-3379]
MPRSRRTTAACVLVSATLLTSTPTAAVAVAATPTATPTPTSTSPVSPTTPEAPDASGASSLPAPPAADASEEDKRSWLRQVWEALFGGDQPSKEDAVKKPPRGDAPEKQTKGATLQDLRDAGESEDDAPQNLSSPSPGVSRVVMQKGEMDGSKIRSRIAATDEATLTYEVRIPKEMEQAYRQTTGKLPGLAGVPDNESLWYASSGGNKREGSWSIRLTPRPPKGDSTDPWWEAYIYAGHAGGQDYDGKWGIRIPLTEDHNGDGTQLPMTFGEWFEVKIHVKMNTPGKNDGELGVWIDGRQGVKVSDVRWREAGDTTGVNEFMGDVFINRPGPPATGYVDFKNFRISTGKAPAPTTPSTPDAASGAPGRSSDGPFAAGRPWVDPQSKAAQAAAAATDPRDKAALQRLAAEGSAVWIGDWTRDVTSTVADVVRRATAAHQTPTFVAYAIPSRDCSGGYSAGGLASASAYRSWIDLLAQGVRDSGAVVVLEPDAVAGWDCLSDAARAERAALLAQAGKELTAAGASVYLDAGTAGWQSPQEMAVRLKAAGVEGVRGFSLNVSNYVGTEASTSYGRQVLKALGGDGHFVIDTSRNGAGPAAAEDEDAWCNPPGRRVGRGFTTATGDAAVDAWLWIKTPGDSDGTCNGGPAAGQWWQERAVQLAGG